MIVGIACISRNRIGCSLLYQVVAFWLVVTSLFQSSRKSARYLWREMSTILFIFLIGMSAYARGVRTN